MPPRILPAPLPTKKPFDPFNSSSTGHQRAENRLAGSTSWRSVRTSKLQRQFADGTGRGGVDRVMVDFIEGGSGKAEIQGKRREGGDIRDFMMGVRKRKVREGGGEELVRKKAKTTQFGRIEKIDDVSRHCDLEVDFDNETWERHNHQDFAEREMEKKEQSEQAVSYGRGFQPASTNPRSRSHSNACSRSNLNSHVHLQSQTRPKKTKNEEDRDRDQRQDHEPRESNFNPQRQQQTQIPPPSAQEINVETEESHKTAAAAAAEKEETPAQIFHNLIFYLNGSTHPLISDHELKYLITRHGGGISLSLARRCVTHVILGEFGGAEHGELENVSSEQRGRGRGRGRLAAGKIQKEMVAKKIGRVRYVSARWVLECVKRGRRLAEGGGGYTVGGRDEIKIVGADV